VARRRDLHGSRRRQVRRRCVDSTGCDRSDRGVPSGNPCDAPAHAGVRRIRHRGREDQLIPQLHRVRRGRHDYGDRGRRRWWWRRDCASSAAAINARPRREKCHKNKSRFQEFSSLALRKGPHALRKAGQGPATKLAANSRRVIRRNLHPERKHESNQGLTSCGGNPQTDPRVSCTVTSARF
jgi:hypothetical protein